MIYYEPHPVSPERKRELRLQGYKIIDAAFAPADWEAPDAIQTENEAQAQAETPAPVKRKPGRPRKAN